MTDSPGLDFRLFPLRFTFAAVDPVRFPKTMTGNRIRGALGIALRAAACQESCPAFFGKPVSACSNAPHCIYARLWEPAEIAGGLSRHKNPPRPYTIRAAHLDGVCVNPGERFHFDLHLFDLGLTETTVAALLMTMRRFAEQGIGPDRRRIRFLAAARVDAPADPLHQKPLCIPLRPFPAPCSRIEIRFVTPMELKSAGEVVVAPAFHVLFCRARDRIANLKSLYDGGPIPGEFDGLAGRAGKIGLIRHSLKKVRQARRSSRTGQIHDIGGWIGTAEYEGELAEFLPWLRAAEWTGIGRQTAWGKGEIRVRIIA